MSEYHPSNVNPVRVGVGKAMALSPAENDALAVELPPVALLYAYVMVNVVAVHCANKVKFDVWPCPAVVVTCVPPLEAVNHPLNEYPAREVVANDDIVAPVVVEVEPLAAVEPPFASYETVNEFAVHLAKSVVLIPVFHGMELPAV